jgi:hypothetical protein
MITLTVPDAYGPTLRGILEDDLYVLNALQRLRHATEAERELYRVRAAIVEQVVIQLPPLAVVG